MVREVPAIVAVANEPPVKLLTRSTTRLSVGLKTFLRYNLTPVIVAELLKVNDCAMRASGAAPPTPKIAVLAVVLIPAFSIGLT